MLFERPVMVPLKRHPQIQAEVMCIRVLIKRKSVQEAFLKAGIGRYQIVIPVHHGSDPAASGFIGIFSPCLRYSIRVSEDTQGIIQSI